MKMKNLMLVAIVLVGSINAADLPQNKMNATTKSKLKLMNKYLAPHSSTLDIQKLQYPYSVQNNQLYVNLLLQVSGAEAEAELRKCACEIITHTKTIYSVKVPADMIAEISALASVKAIEASQLYKNTLDQSKKLISAEQVSAENLTPSGIIGGEGVLVGFVDSGIDLSHPDFINSNGTRVLKLWDMSDPQGKGPEGYENYTWGKEYNKEFIDLADAAVSEVDRVGHGTVTTGIAVGSGTANANFRGIAYNSDLIIVKGNRDDNVPDVSDADVIAGCDYLVKEAGKLNRPIVVNLSLGSSLGSHDGKGLMSVAISELSKPGVVFAVAAGNDNYLPLHAGLEASANSLIEFPIKPNNLCWLVENETNLCDSPESFYTFADFWYSRNMIDSVFVLAYDTISQSSGEPQLTAYKSYPIGVQVNNEAILNDNGEPIAIVEYNATTTDYSANHSGNLKIEIHNNADTTIHINKYIWSIVIQTKNSGQIDMWGGYPISSARQFKAIWASSVARADGRMTINAPGDADSAISVASFITKNSWTDINSNPQNTNSMLGAISDFSSRGPARDGRILPLIAAPGEIIFSAKSKDSSPDSSVILIANQYTGGIGTSVAAPHVTGAIALMLQADPMLGYSDIVDIFEHTAVKDEFTGTERNNTFGLGKINVQAAINYILGVSGVDYVYANDVKVYPNPAVNTINFELNSDFEFNNTILTIYNSVGEKISDYMKFDISGSKLNLNISNLASGIYNVECISGKSIAKFRFAVK